MRAVEVHDFNTESIHVAVAFVDVKIDWDVALSSETQEISFLHSQGHGGQVVPCISVVWLCCVLMKIVAEVAFSNACGRITGFKKKVVLLSLWLRWWKRGNKYCLL